MIRKSLSLAFAISLLALSGFGSTNLLVPGKKLSQFGIVTSMSTTDLVAISIHPGSTNEEIFGISRASLSNLLSGQKVDQNGGAGQNNTLTNPVVIDSGATRTFKFNSQGTADGSNVATLAEVTNIVASTPSSNTVSTTRVLLPLASSSIFYGFGDSQTAGQNFSGLFYTSGGFIQPQYRWLNLLGGGSTVLNYGIGATWLAWFDGNRIGGGNPGSTNSIFNTMGHLTNNWTGVTCIMGGWNDMGSVVPSPAFWNVMQHAQEACIARALIDDWWAITLFGFTRSSQNQNDTPGWTTNGFPFIEQANLNQSDNFGGTPFQFNPNPLWSSGRYATTLTNGCSIQFNAFFKRAVALFFDTADYGGPFVVSVNTSNVYAGTTFFNSGISGTKWPMVVWLDNIPTNAVIKVAGTGSPGQVALFLAAGIVNSLDAVNQRTVLFGAMTSNTNSQPNAFSRAFTNSYIGAKITETAVGAFSRLGYPVYMANNYTKYSDVLYSEPLDKSHFNPAGHAFVAENFRNAYVPAGGYGSSNVISFPNLSTK